MKIKPVSIVLLCTIGLHSTAQTVSNFNVSNPCVGQATTFISTSSSTDNIVSLKWDLDNDTVFDDGVGNEVSRMYNDIDSVNVGLQTISNIGDTVTTYKKLFIGPIPSALYTIQANCIGVATRFTNASTITSGSISNLFWDFGDGSSSILAGNSSHQYDLEGNYNSSLIAMSALGCRDTMNISFEVKPALQVELELDGDSILLDDEIIRASVVGEYDSIIWNQEIIAKSYTIIAAGSNTVRVVNSIGCPAENTFVIKSFSSSESLPNAITPNNDGSNDVWNIAELIEVYGSCKVQIFDNRGSEVYQNKDYDNTWGGTNYGGELPSGIYYYNVSANGGSFSKTGSINIIK